MATMPCCNMPIDILGSEACLSAYNPGALPSMISLSLLIYYSTQPSLSLLRLASFPSGLLPPRAFPAWSQLSAASVLRDWATNLLFLCQTLNSSSSPKNHKWDLLLPEAASQTINREQSALGLLGCPNLMRTLNSTVLLPRVTQVCA